MAEKQFEIEAGHLETLAVLSRARTNGRNEIHYQKLLSRGILGDALQLTDIGLAARRPVPDPREDEGITHHYVLAPNGRRLVDKLLETTNAFLKESE